MGILDVIDRVVVAVPVQMSRSRSIAESSEYLPGCVDSDGAHDVVDGDDHACPLGHPQRLTITDQVHQLSDEELERLIGVIAETGGYRA